MTIAPMRRLLLAFVAIGIAAFIMRSQISTSLVLRGDDLTYRAQTSHAREMYRRAIEWDPDNTTAVDRLCFHDILSHARPRIDDGIGIATRYLLKHPDDATVLADRALAYQVIGSYSAAQEDFTRAGRLANDPRALTFAGFAALHEGRRSTARRLFGEAHRIDAHFLPARRGLEKTV